MAVTLSGVIVGGVIGAIPGIITPFVTYKLKQRYEEKNKRLDRLERLVILINQEVGIWAGRLFSYYFKGDPKNEPISPLFEIKTIVEIFFKDLKPSFQSFSTAMKDFNIFFSSYALVFTKHKFDLVKENFVGEKNALGLSQAEEKEFFDRHDLAYKNLLSFKDKFLSELIEIYSLKQEKNRFLCSTLFIRDIIISYYSKLCVVCKKVKIKFFTNHMKSESK